MRRICGLLVWGGLQTSVWLYPAQVRLFRWPEFKNHLLALQRTLNSLVVGEGVGVMPATTVCWAFPCVVTQHAHSTVCCYHRGLVCWAPVPEPWGFNPVSIWALSVPTQLLFDFKGVSGIPIPLYPASQLLGSTVFIGSHVWPAQRILKSQVPARHWQLLWLELGLWGSEVATISDFHIGGFNSRVTGDGLFMAWGLC